MANENPPESETQAADDPVVDPPEVDAADAQDSERQSQSDWVRIEQMGTLTLPSGASYAFSPGDVLELTSEDAAFVISEGYGAKADEPSGE